MLQIFWLPGFTWFRSNLLSRLEPSQALQGLKDLHQTLSTKESEDIFPYIPK